MVKSPKTSPRKTLKRRATEKPSQAQEPEEPSVAQGDKTKVKVSKSRDTSQPKESSSNKGSKRGGGTGCPQAKAKSVPTKESQTPVTTSVPSVASVVTPALNVGASVSGGISLESVPGSSSEGVTSSTERKRALEAATKALNLNH